MRADVPSKPTPIPITKKEIWAWCFYDFANSSFTTIIVTVAFSVYFTKVVAEGHNPEAWWGWGYGASMLIVGIISPILGALADYTGTKKNLLIGFSFLCILATFFLFFVEKGDIVLGIFLFAIANIGFNGGLAFYNAFLKDLSLSENMGRISGYGFALGYVGGLVSLVLVYPLIQGGLGEENLFYYRLSFPVTAGFFLIFALPSFSYLQERRFFIPNGQANASWTIGLRRVWKTFHEIRRYKELFKFFLAFLIYIDGINTVIVFAGIFAATVLDFSPKDLIIFFIIMQISAALGAYAFGFINDWIGPKRTISITLFIWTALMIWAFFVPSKSQFYFLGLIAGVALGSNQSSSRTLLGLFAPKEKITEFYGFFSLTGKLAATIGPPVYGMITALTGNQRYAVLSLIPFFLIGFLILQSVNEEAGNRREQA
ncbi:MAG TPA: MFS transporter [Nitrospiria bacterium]